MMFFQFIIQILVEGTSQVLMTQRPVSPIACLQVAHSMRKESEK